MKRVSMFGSSFRFMLAIWNSYSKSLTARSPRRTVFTFCCSANLTSSPSKVFSVTRGSPLTAPRSSSTRCLTLKTASLAGFFSTATMSPSNIFRPRWMMLRWPLVGGSNEPGYRAMRAIGGAHPAVARAGGQRRRRVRRARRARSGAPPDEEDPRVGVGPRGELRQSRGKLRRSVAPRRLEDGARLLLEEMVGAQSIDHRLGSLQRVGRVGEDQVEALAAQSRQRAGHIVAQQAALARVFESVDVRLDDRAGARVLLDQDGGGRPPRDRLEGHRPRAGKEVEHAQPLHPLPEQVEDALPHAVRRGSRRAPRHGAQRPPARLSPDDAQIQSSPSWRAISAASSRGPLPRAPHTWKSSSASKQASASSRSCAAAGRSRSSRWWRAAAWSRVAPFSSAHASSFSQTSGGAARLSARRKGPAATSCCTRWYRSLPPSDSGAGGTAIPPAASAAAWSSSPVSRTALGGAPRDLSWRASSAAACAPPSGTTSRPSSSWQTMLPAHAAARAPTALSSAASATPVKPASISRCTRSVSDTALPTRGGSFRSATGPPKCNSSAARNAASTKAESSRASSGPFSSAAPLGRTSTRGASASRAGRAKPALDAGEGATSATSSTF